MHIQTLIFTGKQNEELKYRSANALGNELTLNVCVSCYMPVQILMSWLIKTYVSFISCLYVGILHKTSWFEV